MPSASLEITAPEDTAVQPENSYGQILKSSAWIGGSTLLNIGIGVVRTKVLAILLGPAGFGWNGLYSSVADLSQNLAGMGINSSGVRQIAESVGTSDDTRIAQTVAVLRRTSLSLGLIGALLVALFSRQISVLTFATPQHATAIALLSLAVFFKLVSNGQSALIQGMRRISDLAKMNVAGALLGTLFGIPLVYLFRQNGIVPALVAVAAMTALASWFYSRRIRVRTVHLRLRDLKQECSALLRLGFAFMASTFLTIGAAYAVRVILLRTTGTVSTGYYQAAWTLGGLYVGMILQAMGADFYPRLTALAGDNPGMNRAVNEQLLVGLLLAVPGVLGTLAFAPLVLTVFYSGKFNPAAGILRWIALGTLMQVISWPMGFVVLAKGRANLFLASDVAWTAVYLAFAWLAIQRFGLEGAGIAFFGSYLFHAVLNYAIARRLTAFRWSWESRRVVLLALLSISVSFLNFSLLPNLWSRAIGVLLVATSLAYSLRLISTMLAADRLLRPVRQLLRRFAFVS